MRSLLSQLSNILIGAEHDSYHWRLICMTLLTQNGSVPAEVVSAHAI